jgi:alkanesulfonate monooxygenase SsuD/methylene tetrahydromethanopterin reductase-like flavin-dependent oxidoreductase (luciferase family)
VGARSRALRQHARGIARAGFQLVGTPDAVGEEIQRLKDALDVEYIMFVMYGGITEQKRMLESIRLFGEKVIPKFADAKTPEPALATA